MAFPTMTTSVSNIQTQPDEPVISAATLKALFDKAGEDIVAYINSTLLVALEENTLGSSGAESLGCAAIAGVTGTKVRAILVDLKDQIDAIVLGSIPDASITAAKMDADMQKDIAGGILSYDTFVTDSSTATKRDINAHNTLMMGGLL